MNGKKKILSKCLNYSGVLNLYKKMAGQNRLIVYNYHRVYANYENREIESKSIISEFDTDVFGPEISVFEKQIKWLNNNTNILCESELIRCIETGKYPKGICSLITFDDGYIDNYTLAYPALKKEGISAIFFIPSNQIIERSLGWWDIISYVLRKSEKKSIEYEGRDLSLEPAQINNTKQFFLNKMKQEPNSKTNSLLEKLSHHCGVQLPGKETQSKELMTWKHLVEMAENNMCIGSHTHNHYVLSTLEPEKQEYEIKLSKSIIEEKIGKNVNTFSYPVGGYSHFSDETQNIVRKCGYKVAFSFNTGCNDWKSIEAYNIKRLSPPGDMNMFATTTVLPEVFGWN